MCVREDERYHSYVDGGGGSGGGAMVSGSRRGEIDIGHFIKV